MVNSGYVWFRNFVHFIWFPDTALYFRVGLCQLNAQGILSGPLQK